jgi:hypothetical protein
MPGDWEFSLGAQHWYSYRYSDLVSFLEKLYDEGATIISLAGELEIANPQHVRAKEEEPK